jgi:hypothetical protein
VQLPQVQFQIPDRLLHPLRVTAAEDIRHDADRVGLYPGFPFAASLLVDAGLGGGQSLVNRLQLQIVGDRGWVQLGEALGLAGLTGQWRGQGRSDRAQG